MHAIGYQALLIFMGFFAIMNPVANTPIFVSLTRDEDAATRKAIAIKSLLLAFGIVVACCLAGRLIFELFGLTLPALRITGGILLFVIGFSMLHGNSSAVHNPSRSDVAHTRDAELSVAVSPLAIPILAGPGTIATAINYSAHSSGLYIVITILAFGSLCLITYAFFAFGDRLVAYIGDSAVNVITRLMGLILAVIGTQMLINGVYGAVRAFH